MRYLILIISLMGGLVSFNSYAVSCPVGATVPAGTYKPYYIVNHDGLPNLFINVGGCEYLADSPIWTPEGLVSSSSPFVSTGKPAKEGVSPSVDENNHSPEPSLPDVKPPQPDVTPPKPDTGTTGSPGFSAELSSINSSSADSLYLSYPFDYNFNYTAEQNKQLAQAFLSKLSNVTPPSYYSVDHIYNMMERWQHYYNQLSTPTSSVTYLWNSSHFVGGEHRYLGSIVLAVNSCAEPDYQGHCSDLHKPLDINDPDYASRSDYKNGITRCMRNPNDPSCHSSGGSGDSSPDPVIPDVSGGSSDSSGSSSCPANQFYDPRSRQCLDYSVFHCGDGSEPVFSGSDYPLCEKHSTGSSGVVPVMPGNGHTDSGDGDNGDVVAAINAFHADANKNHQETMDTFTNLPQETPDLIEGYLSPKLNSIIDSMKKEMADGYNDALAEFKGVFGDIDSYIPDIKLSFDLPVQFTSGIRGRCVPLVFDFNITLVGFQPYHFHAEGVQACQLYDTYIRSIVEYMIYFLTALACRRVFIRAAEFITSQP